MRLSRAQMFMEIAHVVAKRSTCHRLNVGAVITFNNRIVSIGYNGRSSGEEHCQGSECSGVKAGRCGTLHAEQNALLHLPESVKGGCLDLYCTDAPCFSCAETMLKEGVTELWFERDYRSTDGLYYLLARGVRVNRITPAGYVIDMRTGHVRQD
jgi:dCMP deaminase